MRRLESVGLSVVGVPVEVPMDMPRTGKCSKNFSDIFPH